jgi:hypothetical protein
MTAIVWLIGLLLRMAGLPKSAKGAHYPEMTMHRTTKRGRGLLAAVLLLLGAWTQSGIASEHFDDSLNIRLVAALAPQWPPDLVIQGVWPGTCLPGVVRTSLIDTRIDVLLRSTGTGCSEVATPLELRVNPVRASGLAQMALGIYQVRLFLLDSAGGARLVGFRLLRAGADDVSARPESGFWWSQPTASQEPALAGSSLSIEQQGENLAVTLLSYDRGAPVWYFGSAPMPGNIVRVPLLRMSGGDEPFAAPIGNPRAQPGLSLNLQFLGPARAQAWLLRADPANPEGVESQELNLLRLPFESTLTGANWRGDWVLVVEDARQASVITLEDVATADAESFRLRDRGGQWLLQCRLDGLADHSIPAWCSLGSNDAIVADFDRIGLDRLSGFDTEGRPVRLVRLPR